jgi:hypothetical protein
MRRVPTVLAFAVSVSLRHDGTAVIEQQLVRLLRKSRRMLPETPHPRRAVFPLAEPHEARPA